MEKGTVFINVSNEFLVDTEPKLQLSQNRFYIAGGCQITNGLNFQLGYLTISRESTVH